MTNVQVYCTLNPETFDVKTWMNAPDDADPEIEVETKSVTLAIQELQ